MNLMKLLILVICAINISCNYAGNLEYGPQLREEDVLLNKLNTERNKRNSQDESPTNVASVSKFIKEFHRQFEEEPYLAVENKNTQSMDHESANRKGEFTSQPQNLLTLQMEGDVANNSSNQTSAVKDGDSRPSNSSTSFVNCNSERQNGVLTVELVNSTRLLNLLTTDANITSKTSKADCAVLLFYSRTCPFSCMAAPHFNALPRAFPAIKMAAVNVVAYQSLNTQYGIVGVPTVMLFHNGRPAAKFNDSEYTLEMFTRFITRYTGLPPEEKMFVTSADFGGPVPSVVAKETDYWLALGWIVIATVGGVAIGKSRTWRALVEAIQNTWREAEAQHPHTD